MSSALFRSKWCVSFFQSDGILRRCATQKNLGPPSKTHRNWETSLLIIDHPFPKKRQRLYESQFGSSSSHFYWSSGWKVPGCVPIISQFLMANATNQVLNLRAMTQTPRVFGTILRRAGCNARPRYGEIDENRGLNHQEWWKRWKHVVE